MTLDEYRQLRTGLPQAAHQMQHITNFGLIIGGGFELLAATLDRGVAKIVGKFDELELDPAAREAKLRAEREAKRKALEAQLAALGDGDAVAGAPPAPSR